MIAYGHALITCDERSFEFVPSLQNIEKIGTPKEIVTTFKFLMSGGYTRQKFVKAIEVLECCLVSHDDDLGFLYGFLTPSYHGDRILMMVGREPWQNAVILARHMLVHGICGKSDKVDKSEAKACDEFKPSDYVNVARRVLELSSEESKGLTMTELLILTKESADAAEKEDKERPPNIKEHNDQMDYLKRINAARKETKQ